MICHDSRGYEVSCGDECACSGPPPCENGQHEGITCVPCAGSGRVDPEPGTYDVAWCTKGGFATREGKRGDLTEHRGISLEMAFAWGEDFALELASGTGGGKLHKANGKRNLPNATSNQLTELRGRLKVGRIPENLTYAQADDLISAAHASKTIDPIARALASQSKGARG
jgi:hypothetical protein